MSSRSYTIPAPRHSAPTYLVQVTTLGDRTSSSSAGAGTGAGPSKSSRMIWVGTADSEGGPSSRRLAGDWACAMPTRMAGTPVASTSLLGSTDEHSGGHRAEAIAQRLARRLQQQIYLSLDIPAAAPAFGISGAAGFDPYATRDMLSLEGEIVRILEAEGKDAKA